MSLAEEELTVQVGDVDGVEIDHLDVLEAAQREGLEQLAPDAAGANHGDYRSGRRGSGSGQRRGVGVGRVQDSRDAHLSHPWRAGDRSRASSSRTSSSSVARAPRFTERDHASTLEKSEITARTSQVWDDSVYLR